VDGDIDPGLVRHEKITRLIAPLGFCSTVAGVSFLNPIASYAVMYLGGAFFIVVIIRG
jgi:hypothetical protein